MTTIFATHPSARGIQPPGPEGGETLLDECHQAVIEEVLESGSENFVARYRNQRGFRASLKHFVNEHPERLALTARALFHCY